MEIDYGHIADRLTGLGLTGQDAAVHSSLSSFGCVSGGAEAVVRALLGVCSTVLMPSFCGIGRTNAPLDDHPAQNAWDYRASAAGSQPPIPFDPAAFGPASDVDTAEMGQIAVAFLRHPGTVRSEHPSVSWAANGPRAAEYTTAHLPDDPNHPLKALSARGGRVLLLGVGLSSCTAVHLAEELAGRRPFVRWVLYADGRVRRTREYGCSDGFPKLAPLVEAIASRCTIGHSAAVCYPIGSFVETIVKAIGAQPEITLCGRPDCRCVASVRGGPVETNGLPRAVAAPAPLP